MPAKYRAELDAKLARRGGAVRVRTVKIGPRKYARVYVVRSKGARGGKTVLGKIKRKGARG
jgi:hypothetical protein